MWQYFGENEVILTCYLEGDQSCIRNESIVGCNTVTHQIQDIHTGQHARILVSQTNFCAMF